MRKKNSFQILFGSTLVVLSLAQLSGCASITGQGGTGKVSQSQIPRNMNPVVPPEDMEELVTGNSALAFDFYQSVRGQGGNLFYSPFSVSVALAMTYAGARGDTGVQMANTFHYTLPQERLHSAFNALDLQLSDQKASTTSGKEAQPFQLSIANSLWGQQDYTFLPEFLDLMALNYGAGLRLIDFASAPEEARKTINDWVSQKTKEKIQDLIPEGVIDAYTRLVLANAIYFKADWLFPFEKNNTQDLPFNILDGSQVNVPMMTYNNAKNLPYMTGNGFQAVELPYVGDTTSMVILVPDAGKFQKVEEGLSATQMESILSGMQPRMVALTLPKFKFEAKFQLKGNLSSMGMPDAFEPDMADFSGMDGTRQLYIGEVFHKAFVAVDEKGTEAAAATAVIMELSSAPLQDIILVVDRPFLFVIREKTTGTILFVGRLLNPME